MFLYFCCTRHCVAITDPRIVAYRKIEKILMLPVNNLSNIHQTAQLHWFYTPQFHNQEVGWFNIKMPSYQYRKSHCEDKTILRPSYHQNGISYTGKMTSLYWVRAQAFTIASNPLKSSLCRYICPINLDERHGGSCPTPFVCFEESSHFI